MECDLGSLLEVVVGDLMEQVVDPSQINCVRPLNIL
jgi:hypothetical protein